jgi:hypothetical protein
MDITVIILPKTSLSLRGETQIMHAKNIATVAYPHVESYLLKDDCIRR